MEQCRLELNEDEVCVRIFLARQRIAAFTVLLVFPEQNDIMLDDMILDTL
jgi:hypothetical protein